MKELFDELGDGLFSGAGESPYESERVFLYQFGVIKFRGSDSFSSWGEVDLFLLPFLSQLM